MNKTHIAFFIPSMRGGGAERMFVNMANEFSKKNFRVDLVIAQKEGPYLKYISNGINIIDLQSPRIMKSLFPLIRFIKDEKPDILLSTIRHVNMISILAGMLSNTNVKLIVRQAIHTKRYPNKIKSLIERYLLNKANIIIAISKGVKDSLIETFKIPEYKIQVIYNPIYNSSIIEKSKEVVKHPFFDGKNKIVLAAGRLTIQKDFPTLIKAFNMIKTDITRLVILGEGKYRNELEDLIKELGLEEHVSLPGFADNPYAYMAKADVFVLSSKIEGFANVLVEAMACGTTVISTDCPSGPSEILDGGKYGKLVPAGNIERLAEAINEAISNPSKKEILINRAKMFSVEKSIEEYLKLFAQVID